MFCPFSGDFRDFGGLVLQEAEIFKKKNNNNIK